MSEEINHSKVNNKRIVKNSLYLYVRMLVIMLVNLYTVRVVLHVLGATDYGIYNVVGGIVTMFSFLNSTLSTSSQRYFSVELANNNLIRVNQWLCLNVTVFMGMAFVVLVLAETIGLWFLNTQMVIPENRLFAANIVYQLSLFTFAAHMFTVPYNALIVAHEKMSAFAYISIFEAFAKFIIAMLLPLLASDHLIVYAILLMLLACSLACSYVLYCRFNFTESKFRFYWNKNEAIELFSFSGCHFLGTVSMSLRSQGINILINLFFSPVVNASRAISYQILNAINQLSANFFTAVKPQIYKSYAAGDFQGMHKLIMRTTTMCMFLVSLVIFPILSNTEFVLGLWLKDLPEYTVAFTQLILINGLIDSSNGPTVAAALATGRIQKYELVVAFLIFLNFPISYIALKCGCAPTITIIVSIIFSIITSLARVYMLQTMINISFQQYLVLFLRLLLVSIIIWLSLFMIAYNSVNNVFEMILLTCASFCIQILVYYYIAIDSEDRSLILKFINKKLIKQ